METDSKNRPVYLWILFIIAIGLFLLLLPKIASSEKSFGECLKAKGVVMYGRDTCKNCLDQKSMFGPDFKNISYINCDFDSDLCKKNRIEFTPTWVLGQNSLVGIHSLPELSQFAGCKLPEDFVKKVKEE